jgi:hypothetical protein
LTPGPNMMNGCPKQHKIVVHWYIGNNTVGDFNRRANLQWRSIILHLIKMIASLFRSFSTENYDRCDSTLAFFIAGWDEPGHPSVLYIEFEIKDGRPNAVSTSVSGVRRRSTISSTTEYRSVTFPHPTIRRWQSFHQESQHSLWGKNILGEESASFAVNFGPGIRIKFHH